LGGAINGAITGGFRGAVMGALLGFVTGAVGGGAGSAMGRIAAFAVFSGVGLGLSIAKDGWKGIITFGAGLLGAYVGGRAMGVNIFDFRGGKLNGTGGPTSSESQRLKDDIIFPHLDDATIADEYANFASYSNSSKYKYMSSSKLSFQQSTNNSSFLKTLFNMDTIYYWGYYGAAAFGIGGALGGLTSMGIPPGMLGFVAGSMLGFSVGIKFWIIGWSVAETGAMGALPIIGNIPESTQMPELN